MILLQVIFSGKADEDLEKIDSKLREYFIKHSEKLAQMPPRRHLKFGVPYHVEDVTKKARLAYTIENNILTVVRCFSTHKEYEKWYKTFK